MANKYYYLIASLPYLEFGKPARIKRDAFLSECEKWLTDEDFKKLRFLDIKRYEIEIDDPKTIKMWKDIDFSIKQDLALARRAKKSGTKETIPASIKDIFNESNPLKMEMALEKKRWLFLEELELESHFDLNSLFVYFLKLQILERIDTFEKDRGMNIFEELCEVKYG